MHRRPPLLPTALALSVAALVAGTLPAAAATTVKLTPVPPSPAATVATTTHAPAAPAAAEARATGHAAVRNGVETVSLQLTPRDRGLLASTAAHASTLSRSVRLARLDAAVAGAGRAAVVARISRGLGLTVVGSTDFAVTVTGSPARVVALFGSARANNPLAPTAQPLPSLPGAYAGLVTVAEGGDDTRPAVLSHLSHQVPRASTAPRAGAGPGGSLSIAQARSLYGVTATTTLPTKSSPIIATLQFSSWSTESSDLKTFATQNSLYAGTFTTANVVTDVTVSNSCGSVTGGGDVEVALDQETLLTEAPQLQQRIYFAPNCGDAQDTAIEQVTSDAKAGKPIIALSTSWGSCEESQYGSSGQASADQNAIQAAEAAGVTVFAASGDDGSSDCVTSTGDQIAGDAVDSPAVIPGVIGVGGTTLSAGGGSVVWNDAPNSATGGGFSCGVYARPTYQDVVAATPRYPDNVYGCSATTARQVPDIAADAGDGLSIVDTQTSGGIAFGTSFAAPLAAGGFAETLVGAGQTTGVGDITGLLYPHHTCGGFQDVLSGNNGSYGATPGYDLVTGLGSPLWPALINPVQTSIPNSANACIQRAVLTKIHRIHHGF